MDEKNRKILGLLEEDARLTYAEIGERVGLAPSSVHDRIRKLERSGVIRRYRADVDFEKVGLPITAFVSVSLRPNSPADVPAPDRRAPPGRVLLLGRRRQLLHGRREGPQHAGPGGDPGRPEGEARGHHQVHDRALDAVRAPADHPHRSLNHEVRRRPITNRWI